MAAAQTRAKGTVTASTLKGSYASSVDLFGPQLTFTFDDGLPYVGI